MTRYTRVHTALPVTKHKPYLPVLTALWLVLIAPTHGWMARLSGQGIGVLHRELNPNTVTQSSTHQARDTETYLTWTNLVTNEAKPPPECRDNVKMKIQNVSDISSQQHLWIASQRLLVIPRSHLSTDGWWTYSAADPSCKTHCQRYLETWDMWLSIVTEQQLTICSCTVMTEHDQIVI